MKNLDYLAAKYGQRIIEEKRHDETLRDVKDASRKAVHILHEQGVFAMFLWLHEKSKKGRPAVGEKLSAMLTDDEFGLLGAGQLFFDPSNPTEALKRVRQQLTKDLTRMLFFKDLLAQTLVYALHRAKAEAQPTEEGAGQSRS